MTDTTTDAREILAKPRFALALPAVARGVRSIIVIRGLWTIDGKAEGLAAITPAAEDAGCRAMGAFQFDPERGMEARPLTIENDDGSALQATYGVGIDDLLHPVFRQLCDMLADVVEARSPDGGAVDAALQPAPAAVH